MIDTNFIILPTNSAMADAIDWDYTTDSPSKALVFASGTRQRVVMKTDTTGEQFGAYSLGPTRAHQRVAFSAYQSGSLPTTAYVGAFCRYVDKDNCLIARVNLNTEAFEVIERINGIANVRGSTVAGLTSGCSMVVEVVDRRVRWWLSRNPVLPEDRPPDGSADLAADWSTTIQYRWGVYWNMNGANSVQLERFQANELANVILPPPAVKVVEAYNWAFSPVTVSVDSFAVASRAWELEVSSLDPDDFVEAFSATIDPSVTSLVIQLRSGYPYQIRVREVRANGSKADWVERTIVASGTKYLPDEAQSSAWTYPALNPDYVLERTQEASLTAQVAEGGRETVCASEVRPRNRWSLKYTYRTKEEAHRVMAFHARMVGQLQEFNWIHPTSGRSFLVRFADDNFRSTINEVDPNDSNLVDFEVELIEATAALDVALPTTFALDPIAFPSGDD